MITSESRIQNDISTGELSERILQIGGGELALWKMSVLSDKKAFYQIYSLINSDNPRLAWRACWIIDNVAESKPELLVPLIPEIVSRLIKTRNGSLKRHFTRMLCRHEIPDDLLGQLVNRCFELISPVEKVAVRVFAMQLLFNISQREPDLIPELKAVLESLLEEGGTAGFKNRAKKLLHKLAESQMIGGQ